MQGFEQLAAEARWHDDSYEQQRGMAARWRLTTERALVHSVADTLLLALGAAAAVGWQRHAGTAIGRHEAKAKARKTGEHEGPLELTDEQRAQCAAAHARAIERRAARVAQTGQRGQQHPQAPTLAGQVTLTEAQRAQCDEARARAIERRNALVQSKA